MCDAHAVPKKDRYTHLQFQMHIAMYWINPEEYEKDHRCNDTSSPQRKKRQNNEVISPLSMGSASVKSHGSSASYRKKTMNDASLGVNGAYGCRLDRSLYHMPRRSVSRSSIRCQLHQWCGLEITKDIFVCSSCDAHLCIDCFEPFHQVETLPAKKTDLKNKYTRSSKRKK